MIIPVVKTSEEPIIEELQEVYDYEKQKDNGNTDCFIMYDSVRGV
jgi:hypothetical protein